MMLRLSHIIVILVWTCSIITAQESTKDTILLKEVMISEKFPQIPGIQKESISQQVLQQNQLNGISDAIKSLPGLQVRSYGPGSLASVYIRGAGASHTRLVWNDMPINSAMTGQSDFSQIPVFFTDNIVLLAGNNSLFSHLSGIGGTISIENRPNWSHPNSLNFNVNAGSFGQYASGLSFSQGGQKFIARTRYMYSQSANDFPYLNNAVLPIEKAFQQNALTYGHSLMQEFFVRNKKTLFSVLAFGNLNEREIPALMTNVSAARHDEVQKDKVVRITGSIERNLKNGQIFFKPGFSYSELQYHLTHFVTGGSITSIDSRSRENSFSSHQGLRWNYKKITLRSGLHVAWHDVKAIELAHQAGYEISRLETGIYTNLEHAISQKFKIVYAVKLDMGGKELLPLAPAIFFSYRPNGEKLPVFFASLGANNKLPSLNDLYYIPGGNPDLKTENSRSAEAGMEDCLFRFLGTCLNVSLTAFHQEITNWIVWQPSQFGYWHPVNIRNARSNGATAGLTWEKEWKDFSVFFDTRYTINRTQAEEEGYLSGQTIYLPEHNLTSQCQFSYKKFKFATDGQYMSARKTALYENTWSPELPPVWIQNISLEKQVEIYKHKLNLGLRLNNVFNEVWQQIVWRPMPGRSFVVSIRFEL
ncbi:MAG: hypothetical protein CVU05_14015 [Bacteroidetes bacterium HGW-Bacteroidetes-21]|jgi:iron complex outermembrane receptor protein|nr:MAG: hypothetical protein CVU05_14015 [Bacteroidetes bacterium HGW-Bacteroidetes-21]